MPAAAYVEQVSHLQRVYALKSTDIDEMRSIYDEWAATYDSDLAESSQDYVGPGIAAAYVKKTLSESTFKGPKIDDPACVILDAGCGTGLVGIHLAQLGAKNVDGIDLSPGMLDVARRTGTYRNLDTADLSKPLPNKNGDVDVITCVGTLTQGHVGPAAIDEFVRVTKHGGVIVATVLDSIWAKEGYEAKVNQLSDAGMIKILHVGLEEYRRGAGVQARMIVLQVQ